MTRTKPMHQFTKVGNQTVTICLSFNEFHVGLQDENGITMFHKTYKEHEVVDALAKYDDLVLAARIEYTLNQKLKAK